MASARDAVVGTMNIWAGEKPPRPHGCPLCDYDERQDRLTGGRAWLCAHCPVVKVFGLTCGGEPMNGSQLEGTGECMYGSVRLAQTALAMMLAVMDAGGVR